MPPFRNDEKSSSSKHLSCDASLHRRQLLKSGFAFAGALTMGAELHAMTASAVLTPNSAARGKSADQPSPPQDLDAKSEAGKIAFDRSGSGEKILMISGFPETRLSWNKLTPLLSQKFECIPADLPSFGDSGVLAAPATTENVGRVFHEFVAKFGTPLHVVAHDFGAWCAYSWALLFPGDFKSLTLMEAGIPGVTLTNDVQVSDYKRKWQFIFQMLPDLPAELTKGKEDIYIGWWFKNKVYKPGSVPQRDVDVYVRAFAREGRMDAAFDYCRNIVADMEFNKKQFKTKLPIRLLAVGGQHSIPNMGDALRPYFENVTSVTVPDSGHFVPEEQPEALAKALLAFF
jgi:pimeloyl-ACP methyl ester carboxylesterase